jgi:hypothetical protein
MDLRKGTAMKDGLDLGLVFDEFLADTFVLDELQVLLTKHAPAWATGIRIWKERGDQRPIDLNEPHSLRRAVIASASERGPTYETMVAKYGAGDERLQGYAELRSKTNGLIVVVHIDEKPLARFAGRLLLGNSISFQIRHSRVEGRAARDWALSILRDACAVMSPVWASGSSSGEYMAKVMSNGFAAGRDFSKFLPGLFWLNFYGAPYVAAMGIQALETVPAHYKVAIGDGFMIQLHPDPSAWATPEYRTAEERARRSIGPDFFFSKASPPGKSRVARFGA